MAEVLLTESGRRELEERLNYLKSVRRAEIAEEIKIARGFGDLSENAEYDAAANVPIAAGDLLNSYGAELDFPDICMARFVELSQEPEFENPFFSLFEALKWCYRISFHIFWEYLEQQNR